MPWLLTRGSLSGLWSSWSSKHRTAKGDPGDPPEETLVTAALGYPEMLWAKESDKTRGS